MKPLHSTWIGGGVAAGVVAAALSGCGNNPRIDAANNPNPQTPKITIPAVPGSRRVVEDYLRAASSGDGAAMYALIASSERDRESPETLGDTARDRYSPAMKWEILKAEESGSTAEVVVDFQGAKVDPNPSRFTLTREAGEWRIVDSPELHEREKNAKGKLRIKL